MTATPARSRAVIAVAAIAVVLLAVGSATLIVGVANRRTTVRNRGFGAVTCTAPQLPGRTVDVTLSDHGSSMMGARPDDGSPPDDGDRAGEPRHGRLGSGLLRRPQRRCPRP